MSCEVAENNIVRQDSTILSTIFLK